MVRGIVRVKLIYSPDTNGPDHMQLLYYMGVISSSQKEPYTVYFLTFLRLFNLILSENQKRFPAFFTGLCLSGENKNKSLVLYASFDRNGKR